MRQDLHLAKDELGWVHELTWRSTLTQEHCHDELECNVIERGSATYLIEGQAVEVTSGDLIWLHPQQRHILINQSRDIRAWILVLRPHIVDALSADLPNGHVLRAPAIELDECRRRLVAADLRLCQSMLADVATLPERQWINSMLPAVVARLWYAHGRGSALPVRILESQIREAKSLLDQDPGGWQRDGLAAYVGLSPAALSRRFEQQVGQSLTTYRNHLRVLHALELLEQRDRRPVLDIAMQAGFGSYPQFHRVFVGHVGITPAAWRDAR